MRGRAFAAAVLLLTGCATLRPMTAGSGDLADYRAFKVAAAPGTRLARARTYLAAHPTGAFAAEVQDVWEKEEPAYFAKAQASREGARRYLADLPDGPHAAAAFALLTALESSMEDAELADIANASRREGTKLDLQSAQRHAVGEAILGAIGVLLDENVYGVASAEGPPPLRALMSGGRSTTWGGATPTREDDLFFTLPTRPARESRLLTLRVQLAETGGLVTAGTIAGADMFVLWAEADLITKLDPSTAEDRTEAQVHAMDRLGGAFERRFPQASCPDARSERELYHRSCAGWEVRVEAGSGGSGAGKEDAIVIRGPAGPARSQGVR